MLQPLEHNLPFAMSLEVVCHEEPCNSHEGFVKANARHSRCASRCM
jgi:hypothetical protein